MAELMFFDDSSLDSSSDFESEMFDAEEDMVISNGC